MSIAAQLRQQFGDIDIYWFDQLLRGRVAPGARILDAGCGEGRNLICLMQNGFEVWGVDTNADAIASLRRTAAELDPRLDPQHFTTHAVEELPFEDEAFDVVISSAVLHFARDESHWLAMVTSMWRVLVRGGFLFARLASTIGHESRVQPLGGRRFIMPDGAERFLVDEAFLMDATARLGGQLLDPLKTTVVQAKRSMTTWVLKKTGAAPA